MQLSTKIYKDISLSRKISSGSSNLLGLIDMYAMIELSLAKGI